ncbi:MAG: AbrB/MazE/SpoVT family DNA-binding domain-containing protein [Haloarculaceae archaeon]
MATERSDEADRIEAESTVTERFGTTIPAEVRTALEEEVAPGDTLRWIVTDGKVSVRIVHEQYGAFDDLEPVDGPEWNGESVAETAWDA